ncbi:MAG: XopAW family type III secretion system calcium-binding effector [Verrucomicrobiota bacterium]
MNISTINTSTQAVPDFAALRQNRFKTIDQDGDGSITRDELAAAIPKNGKGPGVDEIFAAVDTDQDGVISDAEDAAAFEKMQSQGPPPPPPGAADMAASLLKAADSDGDGKISQDELGKVLSQHGADTSNLGDLFKALDSDGDGSVTQSELEKVLKQMLEQTQGNPPPPPPDAASYDSTGSSTSSGRQSVFSVTA